MILPSINIYFERVNIMKKILCLALVSVMMLACMLSASAAATDGYVTDGLEAFYDAASNTEATTWKDLSGKGNDIVDLPNTDTCKFVDGAYLNTATKVYFPAGIPAIINEKASWTTEFVFGDVNVTGTNWGTLANCNNDSYSLFYLVSAGNLVLKNNGSTANPRPTYTLPGGFADLSNKTVSVTFENGVASKLYIDGVEVASAVPAAALTIGDNFFFGHDDATKSHTTEYVAMRFYSRALTADEIAQNVAADKAEDTPAPDTSAPETEPTTPPATGDAGMVFALIALVAMAGVVVVKKNAR